MVKKSLEGLWFPVSAGVILCAFLVPILLATVTAQGSPVGSQAGPRTHLQTGSRLANASVAGDEACGDRAGIVRTLDEEFAERRRSSGHATGGMVVELFTSSAGTWTLLMTRPDGLACLIATGKDWSSLPGALREHRLGAPAGLFDLGPAFSKA